MNKELVEQLQKSLSPTSLTDLGKERRQQAEELRAFLLLDCSGSMGEYCEPNRAKIVALTELVDSLNKQGLKFTQVVFPGRRYGAEVGPIHDPFGGTPLHAALEVANVEEAKHVVVISDGCPDDEGSVLRVAEELKKKKVKVDVFYVGPYPHHGEKFLRGLSTMSGGQFQATSLKRSQNTLLAERVKAALAAPR